MIEQVDLRQSNTYSEDGFIPAGIDYLPAIVRIDDVTISRDPKNPEDFERQLRRAVDDYLKEEKNKGVQQKVMAAIADGKDVIVRVGAHGKELAIGLGFAALVGTTIIGIVIYQHKKEKK